VLFRSLAFIVRPAAASVTFAELGAGVTGLLERAALLRPPTPDPGSELVLEQPPGL